MARGTTTRHGLQRWLPRQGSYSSSSYRIVLRGLFDRLALAFSWRCAATVRTPNENAGTCCSRVLKFWRLMNIISASADATRTVAIRSRASRRPNSPKTSASVNSPIGLPPAATCKWPERRIYRPWSSQLSCVSYGVKVPCHQLPGSDG